MAVFVWVCLIFLLVGLYVVSNQEIKETVKEIEQVVRSVERSLQQCHHLPADRGLFLCARVCVCVLIFLLFPTSATASSHLPAILLSFRGVEMRSAPGRMYSWGMHV